MVWYYELGTVDLYLLHGVVMRNKEDARKAHGSAHGTKGLVHGYYYYY